MKPLGQFECCSCGYRYENSCYNTQCPKCGHLYVKWINYEKLAADYLRQKPGSQAFGGPARCSA